MIPDSLSFLGHPVAAPLWWHYLVFVYSGERVIRLARRARDWRGGS